MRMVMIAALVAAQLSAAGPALAGELPREELATQPGGASAGGRLREDVGRNIGDGQAQEPRPGTAAVSPAPEAAREEAPGKKRKSTGDKVLTGAAVILGVGALAVGGLLVALFVG